MNLKDVEQLQKNLQESMKVINLGEKSVDGYLKQAEKKLSGKEGDQVREIMAQKKRILSLARQGKADEVNKIINELKSKHGNFSNKDS